MISNIEFVGVRWTWTKMRHRAYLDLEWTISMITLTSVCSIDKSHPFHIIHMWIWNTSHSVYIITAPVWKSNVLYVTPDCNAELCGSVLLSLHVHWNVSKLVTCTRKKNILYINEVSENYNKRCMYGLDFGRNEKLDYASISIDSELQDARSYFVTLKTSSKMIYICGSWHCLEQIFVPTS